MLGLAEVISLWLDGADSGAKYRAQYMWRKRHQQTQRANAIQNNTYIAPDDPPICIGTTQFRHYGWVQQNLGWNIVLNIKHDDEINEQLKQML